MVRHHDAALSYLKIAREIATENCYTHYENAILKMC